MLNLKECRNSRKQGDVGLGIAIAWYSVKGYTVSVPLTDNQDYDLVVDDGSGVKRVQVKTTYHKNPNKVGGYIALLKTCGGNRSGIGKIKHFNNKSCDILFAVCDDGSKYAIPASKIKAKASICLSAYQDYKLGSIFS